MFQNGDCRVDDLCGYSEQASFVKFANYRVSSFMRMAASSPGMCGKLLQGPPFACFVAHMRSSQSCVAQMAMQRPTVVTLDEYPPCFKVSHMVGYEGLDSNAIRQSVIARHHHNHIHHNNDKST